MSETTVHETFMREALKEARRSFDKREVPVGAVVVFEHRIIARAHNQMELLHDPTAHAEMIAITQAMDHLILLSGGARYFCNGTVQFVIRRDPKKVFKFAPLQFEAAKSLLAKFNLPPLAELKDRFL
jgi:pyrimidine deaminase RibD-like protein